MRPCPTPLSLGYCPQWQQKSHSSFFSDCLYSEPPGHVQVREDGKGSDLGVSISHDCHINQGSFISRKQLHPAASTSPDGGSLPLPACPSCPPSPADSHSYPSPDTGDRLGQARDTLSFPSLAAPPWGDTFLPSSTPSALSPQALAGVGAGGVVWRGVHRRLTAVVRPGLPRQDALTGTLEQQGGGETPEHIVGNTCAQGHSIDELMPEPRAADATFLSLLLQPWFLCVLKDCQGVSRLPSSSDTMDLPRVSSFPPCFP